jgi:hypothetical protein
MQRSCGNGIELDAIRNADVALRVVRATATLDVEQPARDTGDSDAAGVFVFELQLTALGTTIAQCFPFDVTEFAERFGAPECLVTHARPVSITGGSCR